jgi:hypothetical protein
MADLPDAYISHFTSGRLRLKIPARKADPAYFAFLRDQLSALPGVEAVAVNPVTGSVLIHHGYDPKEVDLKPVAELTELGGLFRLQIPEPQGTRISIAEQVSGTMGGFNAQLKEWSGGAVDFQSLALLALLGVSLFQAQRGTVMIPAITALWYASSLLKDAQSTEDRDGKVTQEGDKKS